MTLSSLAHGAILVTLPWLALELFVQHWWRSTKRWLARRGVWNGRRQGLVALNGFQESAPSLSRGLLWLRAETASFNRLPSKILSRFDLKAGRRREHARSFYDLGVMTGVASLLVSIAVIVFGAYEVIGQIVDLTSSEDGNQLVNLTKRSLTSARTSEKTGKSMFAVHLVPMIPGLTLPWSHLVPLIIALAATQLLHEAGHAICAALYSLEPEKMGMILLYPMIPGAFVVLPREASHMDNTDGQAVDEENVEQETYERSRYATDHKHRMKLQIIAAGIWHNAVTFVILALLLSPPISNTCARILWKDAECLRVQSVDPASPLSNHVPAGACITAVDDIRLDGPSMKAGQRGQTWSAYLTYDGSIEKSASADHGWCVQDVVFQKARSECCQKLDEDHSSQSDTDYRNEGVCFSKAERNTREQKCLDPFIILVKNKVRCSGSCPSSVKGESQTCVVPDSREQLVRLAIGEKSETSRSISEEERVVLFQGDRNVVLQTVSVTSSDFRFTYASWLESVAAAFILVVRYTFTLSLAMAIFNMLPLPSLDGDSFLLILLQSFSRGHGRRQTPLSALQLSLARHQSLLVEIHSRLRWVIMALTIFVVGGSIFVHSIHV